MLVSARMRAIQNVDMTEAEYDRLFEILAEKAADLDIFFYLVLVRG